jgi:D-alanyl-lipoteichoic acid acyltransferase DltB (MBOAT superfamily)
MLFHSQAFILVFLPLVTLLYYRVAGHAAARELVLIVASAVFYGWWDIRFVPLLVIEVAAGWLVAELYFRTGWRWLLPAGIALFLAVLGLFKYLDFFTGIIGAALGVSLPPSGIVLPIGISFFTFQLVSYLIDLRRGDVGRYPFRRFAVVILLFPHLIAGPIVRHAELVPQLARIMHVVELRVA